MKKTGITAIYLENFKGISESVKIPLKPITLLFGANSAGKSTIIQAIHYIREIILRNNPNANFTETGGEVIDLGGYSNLVNLHDTEKEIVVGFDITPDDDGIPHFGKMFEVLKYDFSSCISRFKISDSVRKNLNAELNEYQNTSFDDLDLSSRIDSFNIKARIQWDLIKQTPRISEISFSFNSIDLIDIISDRIDQEPYLTNINFDHPLFEDLNADEGYEKQNYKEVFELLSDENNRINLRLSDNAAGALLPTDKPLLFDLTPVNEELKNYANAGVFYLNQLVLGSLKLLKGQLSEFRYLGPIRKIPERHHVVPAFIEERRWADGMAAWDLLYKGNNTESSEDTIIDKTNKYLSKDYTDVGYQINLKEYRELPIDNMGFMGLKKLLANFEDEDEAFLRTSLALIENIEVKKRVELVDVEKQIAVRGKDIGVGISQVIPVIVGAVDSSKKIFAVEQPELHLHPKVQCDIADIFIEQMNTDRERTFILETHSEHLVLRFLRRIRESNNEKSKFTNDDLSILYVISDEEGTSIINLRVDEQGQIIDSWPGGFFPERMKEMFGE